MGQFISGRRLFIASFSVLAMATTITDAAALSLYCQCKMRDVAELQLMTLSALDFEYCFSVDSARTEGGHAKELAGLGSVKDANDMLNCKITCSDEKERVALVIRDKFKKDAPECDGIMAKSRT